MTNHDRQTDEDLALLPAAEAAVRAAGQVLLARFRPDSRIDDRAALLAAIDANDHASTAVLRPALERLRPSARWDDDEEGSGSLGAGEWWVADAAEGNVNHIHGGQEWGVTATLVRDDVPVLTVVHLPALGHTYTAVRGGGALLDGEPIHVSAKTDIGAALVGTGQAKPGEDPAIRRLLARSVDRALDAALLVSVVVPATLQLVRVAAGHTDAFWQYGQVRSGLVAGALLVQEAGGAVTDTAGDPWRLDSDAFIATTPGLIAPLTRVVSS